jgi:predicted transposase YbfD/YdcC
LNLLEIGLSLVAIDGKRFGTNREATHPACRAVHSEEFGFQVHALRAVHVSSAVKPVLGQRIVELGDGEVNTLWPFVEELLANYGGFVECVSFDAGMTGYLNATRLESAGVFYIAALKNNCRKALFCAKRDLGEGEADPKCGWTAQTVTVEGSKRTIRRLSRAESRMQNVDWQGVSRQVWRVQKRVEERDGRVVVEDRYFLTNLPWERLKPSQCLAAVRAHWGIENDCNWTLDMQLLEDTVTWVNQGEASEVLSILRLIAYNFLRLLRCRVLRSERNRLVPWRRLQMWVRDALIAPHVWEPDGVG